ncbi:MAG: lipase family protein [Rheinheimera sp.]|nr:lipase family protein [Rheinheimera sp.]
MATLTPKLAVQLASAAYDIKAPGSSGIYYFGKSAPDIDKSFQFDMAKGPIQGISGSILARMLKRSTGFAAVGKGKGQYDGDHVIAIRGTASLSDGITDAHIGLTGGDNNALIHAGFNKTFQSMKPALENTLTPMLARSSTGTVHCVGHSLGGALAHITADWVKRRYKNKVFLYTFGAPRVGLDGFALKTSNNIDRIFRCTHAADPVPMVPLWPFVHAPYQGEEVLLAQGQGISFAAHKMAMEATPGYLNTASSNSWRSLQTRSSLNHIAVRFKYENRHQASFSNYWAEKISSGLITLLKDAGYYTAVMAQAAIGTGLTFYDMLARTLEAVAKASTKLAEQTKGLLGHMLVFARQAVTTVAELSYKFIRWVFDVTLGALYRTAREAINSVM